ncbi:hypothetical protein BCON_0033g00640 [Botryotinia convoluta]|uniref:Uncharacterized protein n=1 Tax=Botryotinia convoluta TaxID=54673 RepID=A0A4Z1IMW2_9HELO|nr:hypothetical protein BCON_0033g00640 [Botryotinia convoluta]
MNSQELSASFEFLLMGSSPISAQSKIYGTVESAAWAQRYFVAVEIPYVEDAQLMRILEDISANRWIQFP